MRIDLLAAAVCGLTLGAIAMACWDRGFFDFGEPESPPVKKGTIPSLMKRPGTSAGQPIPIGVAKGGEVLRTLHPDSPQLARTLTWLQDIDPGRFGRATTDHLEHRRVLDLSGRSLDVEQLELLRSLPVLTHLYLGGTGVTNDSMTHMVTLTQLETLDLSGTRIDDEGVQLLTRLPNLAHLSLDGTAIGDEALATLEQLGSLRFLDVRGTRLTPAGLDRLATALRHCRLIR